MPSKIIPKRKFTFCKKYMRSNKIVRLKKLNFWTWKNIFVLVCIIEVVFQAARRGKASCLPNLQCEILPPYYLDKRKAQVLNMKNDWCTFVLLFLGHLWEVAFWVAKIPTIWILTAEILFCAPKFKYLKSMQILHRKYIQFREWLIMLV